MFICERGECKEYSRKWRKGSGEIALKACTNIEALAKSQNSNSATPEPTWKTYLSTMVAHGQRQNLGLARTSDKAFQVGYSRRDDTSMNYETDTRNSESLEIRAGGLDTSFNRSLMDNS